MPCKHLLSTRGVPGTVGAWRGIDACCRCLFKYFPSLCFFPALGGGSLVFRGELLDDDGGGVGGGTEASVCNNAGDNIKTCLYTITALSGHCETTSCKLQYSRGWYLFYLPAQIIFKAPCLLDGASVSSRDECFLFCIPYRSQGESKGSRISS